jgi:hypothetical protein
VSQTLDTAAGHSSTPEVELTPFAVRQPFGLGHLMVWVAMSAVYLGVRRIGLPEDIWKALNGGQFITLAIGSIGGGAALGVFPLLIARRLKGVAFPIHPGEWLLLALGCRTLFSLDVTAPLLSVFDGPLGWRFYNVASALLFIAVAVLCRRSTGWLSFFAIAALMHTMQFVSSCAEEPMFDHTMIGGLFRVVRPTLLGPFDPLMQCAVLAIIGMLDTWQQRRPWTHWAGIVAYSCLGLASLSSFVIRTLY